MLQNTVCAPMDFRAQAACTACVSQDGQLQTTCDHWLDVAVGAEVGRPAYAAERQQSQTLLCLAAALALLIKSPGPHSQYWLQH